jgi:hypothetical protein
MQANCDRFSISLDEDRASTISPKGRNFMFDGGEYRLVGAVLPYAFLHCEIILAVSVAKEGKRLLAVQVLKAKLNVLLHLHLAI